MSVLILLIAFLLCERYAQGEAQAIPYYVRRNPTHFIEQPQSTKVFPATPITLSCAVNNIQNIISGYNTIEMHWEFDGKKVENPEMLGNVTILHEHGRLQLKFQHLNQTNAGRYRCVMQDGLFSIVSEVAELTLYEFSGFIDSLASNITTYHGDNIYIDCRANTNLPVQGVTWHKNNALLGEELNHRYIVKPDGVLVIFNATDLDAGNYTCRLNLLSEFQERNVEVEIKSLTADSQLKFLYKPQNKSVSLNDNDAYLLCVATGGVSLYTWLKDGVSINNSGVDYHLAAGGSILSFSNVTTNIQGVYTCVVESETNQTINGSAWLYLLIPPINDDSVTIEDVLIEIKSNSLPVSLKCPIKKSSPPPNIVWLHNGVPINLEELDDTLSFSTEEVPTTTGYDYILRITSNNGTYQFIYDNVIGMYQCIASNEAGHTIVNQRVLFKYKPNPVDRPVLHDPVCGDGCSFLVTWNETDYYYSSLSHVNYVVYMSVDGEEIRATGCINVHSTDCTVEYSITEIKFGMYAAAVQTVFYYDYLVPDKTSDLSSLSNVVQLNHQSYPKKAIKPCEVTCNSYTQDDDIHMHVSWKLCPHEQFLGYVDNYKVILNCSEDGANNIFYHTTSSPAILNHTFDKVPCFRHCKVLVKKLSSNSNSNSTVTECERTPKQSPQHAVYNLTVERSTGRYDDDGITICITFDLPPAHEMCSSEHVSNVIIKWKGSDSDSSSDKNVHIYDVSTNNVISYEGRGTVDLQVNDSYRWKAVYVTVSFNNSQGSSPWSEWSSVGRATNGDIKAQDLIFKVTGSNSSSITVGWTLSSRAKSMKQAQFIKNFDYFMNDVNTSSMEETYTFSNLKSNTNYLITSRFITTDNDDPLSYFEQSVSQTTSTEPSTDPTTIAASDTSSEGLSDTVIIVITVCSTAVVIMALLVFLIFRKKSRTCTNSKFSFNPRETVVSHHRLVQNNEISPDPSTQSTQSEIGVPTTPKKELVKEWLIKNPSHRNNPAGSDGQPVTYSEENVQSDGGQDNDINYMLSKINKDTQFVLEPPPTRKNKNIITLTTKAEVERPFGENELEINSSAYFSDKEGDYAKIASDAPGASTSGGSKQFQMGSFLDDLKASPPFEKMTQFCLASPKSLSAAQYFGEGVPVQWKDSIDHSSDTAPYFEEASSNDSPPYLENENVELLAESRDSKYDSIVNTGEKVHGSPPSILLSSHASEGSSASFQGEGYVSEENAILLGSVAATNGSTRSQLNNNSTNPNSTTGFALSLDESMSTCTDGQYISPAAMENIILPKSMLPQKTVKKSSEGTSSVDSDCIDCRDNPKLEV